MSVDSKHVIIRLDRSYAMTPSSEIRKVFHDLGYLVVIEGPEFNIDTQLWEIALRPATTKDI